jgi:hypothetical protein
VRYRRPASGKHGPWFNQWLLVPRHLLHPANAESVNRRGAQSIGRPPPVARQRGIHWAACHLRATPGLADATNRAAARGQQ